MPGQRLVWPHWPRLPRLRLVWLHWPRLLRLDSSDSNDPNSTFPESSISLTQTSLSETARFHCLWLHCLRLHWQNRLLLHWLELYWLATMTESDLYISDYTNSADSTDTQRQIGSYYVLPGQHLESLTCSPNSIIFLFCDGCSVRNSSGPIILASKNCIRTTKTDYPEVRRDYHGTPELLKVQKWQTTFLEALCKDLCDILQTRRKVGENGITDLQAVSKFSDHLSYIQFMTSDIKFLGSGLLRIEC